MWLFTLLLFKVGLGEVGNRVWLQSEVAILSFLIICSCLTAFVFAVSSLNVLLGPKIWTYLRTGSDGRGAEEAGGKVSGSCSPGSRRRGRGTSQSVARVLIIYRLENNIKTSNPPSIDDRLNIATGGKQSLQQCDRRDRKLTGVSQKWNLFLFKQNISIQTHHSLEQTCFHRYISSNSHTSEENWKADDISLCFPYNTRKHWSFRA